MKRPICEEHTFDIKMNRLYVRIDQKFTAIGWICLTCGEQKIDIQFKAIIDKNQKSILDFKKEKVDE